MKSVQEMMNKRREEQQEGRFHEIKERIVPQANFRVPPMNPPTIQDMVGRIVKKK